MSWVSISSRRRSRGSDRRLAAALESARRSSISPGKRLSAGSVYATGGAALALGTVVVAEAAVLPKRLQSS